jgi:hypothetical protein
MSSSELLPSQFGYKALEFACHHHHHRTPHDLHHGSGFFVLSDIDYPSSPSCEVDKWEIIEQAWCHQQQEKKKNKQQLTISQLLSTIM